MKTRITRMNICTAGITVYTGGKTVCNNGKAISKAGKINTVVEKQHLKKLPHSNIVKKQKPVIHRPFYFLQILSSPHAIQQHYWPAGNHPATAGNG